MVVITGYGQDDPSSTPRRPAALQQMPGIDVIKRFAILNDLQEFFDERSLQRLQN
jgi:hypothetical protein